MSRVIFLVYHGMGHFNASLKPAKILEPEHEVFLAGAGFFKSYVESQGLKYYPLKTVPFGLGFETWVNTINKSSHVYFNTLCDRWTNRLFYKRAEELKKMLEELMPETILIDSLQSTDFIVLYPLLKKNGIRVAFYNTMPSLVLEPGKPPVNSLVFPHDKQGIRNAIVGFKFDKLKKSWGQKIKYFGKDDTSLVRMGIEKNTMPHKQVSYQTPLGIVIQAIPEIIFMPQELEFREHEPLPHQHYAGFMIDTLRREGINASHTFIPSRADSGKKLIYCSLGTVEAKNSKRIRSFVQKLVAAVTGSSYQLIVSLPTNLERIKPQTFPENVFFLKSVPQLKILSQADLFITHGGLNSIKESICLETPLLVYPVDSTFDQRSNSTRVVYHKLGLRGDIRYDSVNTIRTKMEEVITNPVYKQHIQQMKKAGERYSDERFLFIFNGIRPVSNNF